MMWVLHLYCMFFFPAGLLVTIPLHIIIGEIREIQRRADDCPSDHYWDED